jgi:polygalacturonase
VLIPDGEFFTAPIRLKSNVNLHLSDSTILKFTADPSLFDTVQTRIEGIDCYNISPLIYAYGETNIAITGNGVMDGQADSSNWFSESRIRGMVQKDGKKINEKTLLYEMKEDSIPFKERVFMRENGIRPQFVNLYKCKNILLEGFTLNRSPFWLIHPLLSENITVRKVKMQSHGYNNDGCDPESCRNVLIEDCDFDTGDDCIAIKSGRDEDGRYWNIPSENIIVRHCRMKDGHAGVAIGSEKFSVGNKHFSTSLLGTNGYGPIDGICIKRVFHIMIISYHKSSIGKNGRYNLITNPDHLIPRRHFFFIA